MFQGDLDKQGREEMCRDVSNTVHMFQGDLDKQRDGPVFLTLHDVGHSYLAWVNFVNTPEMEAVRRRSDPLKGTVSRDCETF